MKFTVFMSLTLLPCTWDWNPVLTAMCASVCPMLRQSGAGLKSYLFSGISSAILIVFSLTVRNAAASSLPP